MEKMYQLDGSKRILEVDFRDYVLIDRNSRGVFGGG